MADRLLLTAGGDKLKLSSGDYLLLKKDATVVTASAVGAATAAGTAVGARTVLASALGAATAAGTSSAVRTVQGSALGSAVGAGSATAVRTVVASAVGAATAAGSAVGQVITTVAGVISRALWRARRE